MSFQSQIGAIISEVEKVIVGKNEAVTLLVTALLSGGHALIEDVPGVGKTTLAKALGKAAGLTAVRAQFTPDVTASDVTGFNIFNKNTGLFEFRPGFVNTNILIADEINRTSPKTQSALLEAMEERTVSVDGDTYSLPSPFMVIATQNELGYVGTYPLPEAQLDRFLMKISIGYPNINDETEIIRSRHEGNPLVKIRPVMTCDEMKSGIEEVHSVVADVSVCRYIAELVAATRTHKHVELGASPRAGILLMRASQSRAYMNGRDFITPEDALSLVPYVLPHRILLTGEAKLRGVTAAQILRDTSRSVVIPYK
ncbi:MAG: MoxR family ATPase [Oscillospiraceae bacterium]|jgi:MoxR-like ATPase|nr:MoxR family ATPase [Oscillospiraceae bacterium]